MLHQIEALEAEQDYIDSNANTVEKKLRLLMETGRLLGHCQIIHKM